MHFKVGVETEVLEIAESQRAVHNAQSAVIVLDAYAVELDSAVVQSHRAVKGISYVGVCHPGAEVN